MKVLITAGPTYEPIDPVRFVGNHSSGKMGIAIAEAFAKDGNNVTLIKGPTHLNPTNSSIQQILVKTAEEMYQACEQYFSSVDVIVFAAAVADYRPKNPSATKLKKTANEYSIEMIRTKDIAEELGKLKAPNQTCVGFALETDNEIENAKEKLRKKNFDFVVLNSMRDEGAGFQYDTNKVTILDKHGKIVYFDVKNKPDVARDIVDYVIKIRST